MRYFEKNKPRPLRWHILQPLMITFILLWLGTMMLFTSNTCNEMETRARTSARDAKNSMEEYFENTKKYASELGEEANPVLCDNLSTLSLGQVSEMDGGIAFVVRTATEYVRSQLTWGWGHQEGIDIGKRWHFIFDEGLDDQGQLALANWIIEHRDGWEYTIYPKGDEAEIQNNDGSFARVTGIERDGYEIVVQKIEIIHPDGSVETMVETNIEGEGKVWDFAYMRVRSVLLPSWSSNGKNGAINMERRLSSFREAHTILDREMAGEQRSVVTGNGFLMETTDVNGVVNCVAVHCDVLPAALKQNIDLYLSTALLTLAVLLFLSAKLSKQVTLPVETLCFEVKKGKCQTDSLIEELNTLAIAFHTAQQKLAEQLKREQEFTRSAAHELKTPLTILSTHAECLKEDISPEKRNFYLHIILEESNRMANLVNNLLELARLESGQKLNMECVALDSLIQEVWEAMALALEEKKITLSMSLEELLIEGDKERLCKIITNLASNALRHTTEGGEIQVSLYKENGKVVFWVDNDGSLIPEEEIERIWEPFYRVDKSRNRSDGGTGLGLAIVYEATLAHGGECEVTNRVGGVCFKISLPQNLEK